MSTINSGRYSSIYYPCCCGCTELTQRRFFRGCDTAFYGRLRRAIAVGDQQATEAYALAFKNNRASTFDKQRETLLAWATAKRQAGT